MAITKSPTSNKLRVVRRECTSSTQQHVVHLHIQASVAFAACCSPHCKPHNSITKHITHHNHNGLPASRKTSLQPLAFTLHLHLPNPNPYPKPTHHAAYRHMHSVVCGICACCMLFLFSIFTSQATRQHQHQKQDGDGRRRGPSRPFATFRLQAACRLPNLPIAVRGS